MYFLTDIDPNIDAKGSRDPLGFQSVWSALGRKFVAHLTTVTTSLRGFSTLLLGLELAERALDSKLTLSHELREKERLACFLRFEQLAAYSRHVVDSVTDIRGINRVKRRLNEGDSIVTIGDADQHQILAEQRTYGLWGLYMAAARGSGLVEDADARPTAIVREHLDACVVPKLGKSALADITRRVRDDARRFEPRGRDRDLAKVIAKALGPSPTRDERAFLRSTLISVNPNLDPTHGSQEKLWTAMRSCADRKTDWTSKCSYSDVLEFSQHAPSSSELHNALAHVLALEPLLAVCEELFAHLLGSRRVKKATAAEACRKAWGKGAFRHLNIEAVGLNAGTVDHEAGAGSSTRLSQVLIALREDSFEEAITMILHHNDAVMRARGGPGWIDHSTSELRARLHQQFRHLPARDELATLWRNTYFLDALRWLGAEIEALSEPKHER